ncbi:putative C6 transcription factor [Aspergillus lucknowensis]|uniref:Zn(2)-C6 fungal-type domain-containing protein n=1 Tax=Aspergillus lucknowensis TaxID=176173 RepID=A0ABR4M2F0_9EURO
MTPTEGTRRRLRSNHACINCRRKKTRCPGEKPACSCCVRLNQQCSYAAASSTSGPRNDRLAELEEKVNQILRGTATRQPTQQEQQVLDEVTDYSTAAQELNYPQDSGFPSVFGLGDASPQLSSLAVARAIDLYLECCHRQPVWCLNIKELGNLEAQPEELLCSILALTIRFSRDAEDGQRYADTAKSLIMLRIANGTVELATIESLCLLAYSSFIDGQLQLGRFHLGLALQLCRAAMLDTDAAYTREDRQTERKKRLFWSLQLLEQSYGRQTGLLSTPTGTWRPRYLSNCGHRDQERNTASAPPPVPRDAVGCSSPDDTGIWSMSIHFGWVWSKVRAYVADCASNRLTEPWRHESMYSVVLSDLTEIENNTPLCHRYDHVQFYRRTAEELAMNRAYWVPWVKLQFMYHAILTVLNHPFLYIMASQHNPNLAIPNSFWRRSSELVLLHATWIVRLIDMISEKNVRLADPFFAHVAAIAASVQLYFCCADDPRLKYKSRADFAKCSDFLRAFVPFSRACEVLSRKLDELTRIASGSDIVDLDDWVPSKIHLNIPLVWDILQFNVADSSSSSSSSGQGGESLLHPSLAPTSATLGAADLSTLDIIVTASPEVSVNTADGGQAVPMPLYRSPTTTTTTTTAAAAAESLRTGSSSTSLRDNALVAPVDSLMLNTPWLWADSGPFGGNMDEVEYQNQNQNHGPGSATAVLGLGEVEGSAWWNLGNL